MLAPTHAAPELVQLGQPEPVGALDQHNRGIGHVDAHLHHCRSNQDVQFGVAELAHSLILFRRGHAAVEQAQLEIGKNLLGKPFVLVGGSLGLNGFGLLNQGADNEGLPAGTYFPSYETVGCFPPFRVNIPGLYFLPTRGQFVYD